MANLKQAKKRMKQTVVRNTRGRALRSRIRTHVKRAEAAIESGEKEAIATSFKAAMAELHKGVSKGVVKQSTASRKISRLAARIRSQQEAAK